MSLIDNPALTCVRRLYDIVGTALQKLLLLELHRGVDEGETLEEIIEDMWRKIDNEKAGTSTD